MLYLMVPQEGQVRLPQGSLHVQALARGCDSPLHQGMRAPVCEPVAGALQRQGCRRLTVLPCCGQCQNGVGVCALEGEGTDACGTQLMKSVACKSVCVCV